MRYVAAGLEQQDRSVERTDLVIPLYLGNSQVWCGGWGHPYAYCPSIISPVETLIHHINMS